MSLFDLEVKEKKFQASLNRSRTGTKGGSRSRKGMSTAYDYMDRKAKRNLIGEVKVSNMYETIIPIGEFELKDKETQKLMLTRWREIFDNDKIIEDMKIGKKVYYDLIGTLDVPRKARGGRRAGTGVKKNKPKAETPKPTLLELAESLEEPQKQEIQKEVVKTLLITKGLHLEYNGTYDVEALNRLFTKLQLLVDGEPCKYNISLSLSEVDED